MQLLFSMTSELKKLLRMKFGLASLTSTKIEYKNNQIMVIVASYYLPRISWTIFPNLSIFLQVLSFLGSYLCSKLKIKIVKSQI